MANWYGTARSNYVRVKNGGAFRAWVQTLPDIDIVQKKDTFALFVNRNSEFGGWPTFRWPADNEMEYQDIDIAAEIVEHLAPSEVFIMFECGAEKLRYLTGWATAVDDTGRMLHVSIDDIYSIVKKRWKRTPTLAVY